MSILKAVANIADNTCEIQRECECIENIINECERIKNIVEEYERIENTIATVKKYCDNNLAEEISSIITELASVRSAILESTCNIFIETNDINRAIV